jgi:hypothetical protein
MPNSSSLTPERLKSLADTLNTLLDERVNCDSLLAEVESEIAQMVGADASAHYADLLDERETLIAERIHVNRRIQSILKAIAESSLPIFRI